MKTALYRITIALLIFLSATSCLFLAPLFIIDTLVLPTLFEKFVPLDKSATISRLTPYSVMGALRFEHEGHPVVSIPYMKLSYNPGFLFSRHLSSLRLDHATIHVTRTEQGFYLPGLPASSGKKADRSGHFFLPLLPVTIDKLALRECSIVIHEKGKPDSRFTLSSTFKLKFTEGLDDGHRLTSIIGKFILFDTINGTGDISLDLGPKKHNVQVAFDTGPLPITDLIPSISNLDVSINALKARTSCTIDADTFSLVDFKTSGLIEQLHGTHKSVSFAGAGENSAVPFSLSGSAANFDYSVGPVAITKPLSIETTLAGSGALQPAGAVTEGILNSRLHTNSSMLDEEFHVPLNYSSSFTADNGWQINFSARSIKNSYSNGKNIEVIVPALNLEGTVMGDGTKLDANAVLRTVTPFSITKGESELLLSDSVVKTTITHTSDQTAIDLSITTPFISLPSKRISLTGLHLMLPIKYPFSAETENSGVFSIKEIRLQERPLASIFSIISQQQQNFSFSGSIESDYLPASELNFDGNIAPFSKAVSFSWHMNKSALTSAQLSPFMTIPEGLEFEGSVATNGTLSFLQDRLTGEMQTILTDGSLNIAEKDTSVSGINCNLELPRLPEIASGPGQYCTVNTVDFGNIHFSDARVHFRIDDIETVFVEKSKIAWCQGLVESTSMRLSSNDNELDTTLYCSKINFADILNQFGLDQAAGEGTVNGKLPIQFSKKGLHFDDGFLFSTPGTGGIVKFSNTDMLRQGVGAVNAGGYLDYSMKAMEDFSYNWTKLSFNSSGEELLLTMQLDGKPRTPLPYKFKNGMIVETAQEDGMQYPIRLDVNFRLPLADIFNIGQNIQSIRENM